MESDLQARMKNPAAQLPGAMQAIQGLLAAARDSGAPPAVLELVHLRASQVNGCGPCVDSGARQARRSGETDERLFAVAAWRETPFFTEAERAALALAEAVTRLSDRTDAVPDDVWDAAARHFEPRALAGLVLHMATTNFFNRLNVATRQIAGSAW